MIKGTCLKPMDRAAKIQQLFPIMNHENDEYIKSFQLEISKEMAVIPARVLPAPMIEFRGANVAPQQGGWQVMKAKVCCVSLCCKKGRPLAHISPPAVI